jgi:hypothetical protein
MNWDVSDARVASSWSLAHFFRMVQVSRADRRGERGEERERRLMASSQ